MYVKQKSRCDFLNSKGVKKDERMETLKRVRREKTNLTGGSVKGDRMKGSRTSELNP